MAKLLALFFLLVSLSYASSSVSTCPNPQSFYLTKDKKGDSTNVLEATGGWKQVRDESSPKLHSLDKSKFYFVRVQLYKTDTLCTYGLNNSTIYLNLKQRFHPYNKKHWHSMGYSMSDPKFELFECGNFHNSKRQDVSFCQFSS